MPNLYTRLSKLRYLDRNYSLKFLFVAFIGIHIPLITIVVISITNKFALKNTTICWGILLATLFATTLTLYFLNKLLWPLRQAKTGLENYIAEGLLPAFPTQFKDEAGILLKELQETLTRLDQLLHEKKDAITILTQDVKAPFYRIMQLSEEIIKAGDKTGIRKSARDIRQIALQNSLVLDDLLAHLEETGNETHTAPISVEPERMLTAACEDFSMIRTQKQISFSRTGSEIPFTVKADPVLLSQALHSLLLLVLDDADNGIILEISSVCTQGNWQLKVAEMTVPLPGIPDTGTLASESPISGEARLIRKMVQRMGGLFYVSQNTETQKPNYHLSLPLVES